MGPKRKKSRQNSQAPDASQSADSVIQQTQDARPANATTDADSKKPTTINTTSQSNKTNNPTSSTTPEQSSTRSSWYGGSWRSKASPVAQVRRESISVAGGATSESSAKESSVRPGLLMNSSLRGSRKSIPLAAEATRVNVTGSNTEAARSKEKVKEVTNLPDTIQEETRATPVEPMLDPPLPPDPDKDIASGGQEEHKQAHADPGWFGWWSRPDNYPGEGDKAREGGKAPAVDTIAAQEEPLPLSPQTTRNDESKAVGASVKKDDVTKPSEPADPANAQDTGNNETLQVGRPADTGSVRSWFGLWSAAQNQETQPSTGATNSSEPVATPPVIAAEPTGPVKQAESAPRGEPTKDEDSPPKSSGWAFWSKDSPKDQTHANAGTQKRVGEIAVADTPSQSHPEAAQFNEEREQQAKAKDASKPPLTKHRKSSKSISKIEAGHSSGTETATQSRSSTPDPSNSGPNKSDIVPKAPKQSRPNLILPSFHETYSPAYYPTYLEQIGQYLASSLRLAEAKPSPSHVYVNETPPKIKSAIAIGVHGYFPAPLIQKVLGQPTGTSIRFANYAAAAIRSWTEKHQPDIPCEVEQVALEGEGFIADRVTTLWKLMLNWLSHLRNADLILVACHSQGVPVAIMLVAKLIQLGCLSPTAKIGVCAMAGVNLGPFADYKSRFFGGSAAELFEFSRPESKVSREYASSLEVVLRHGVRVTYIGSLDDQLVSLEVRQILLVIQVLYTNVVSVIPI